VGLLDGSGDLCLAALESQERAASAAAFASTAAASGVSSDLQAVRQRLLGLRAALSGGSAAPPPPARPSPHTAASDTHAKEKLGFVGGTSAEAEGCELPRQAPKPLAEPVAVVTQPALLSAMHDRRRLRPMRGRTWASCTFRI